MDYTIHNFTENYSKLDKSLTREMILYKLKGYSLFIHLRDSSLSQLDCHNIDQWLIPTDYYYEEIESTKKSIESRRKEIDELTEDKIQKAYQNEIDRLNWYNNPKSNFYRSSVARIEKAIEFYKPDIEKFCQTMNEPWITKVFSDMIETCKTQLVDDRENMIIDDERRTNSPYKIPSYEEFKKKFIKDKENFINHLESRIKDLNETIKISKEHNKIIKRIFYVLNEIGL